MLAVVVMAAVAGLTIYEVVSRGASPGPGWRKVGSIADIERQGVTRIGDSAYVVSYGDLPVFAFAASYDEGVEGIHEVVSYCTSGGYFYNEPHATRYDIVGRYILGPAPSSTLPRVAVTVLDGEVWVDPEQPVSGLIPGAMELSQRPKDPSASRDPSRPPATLENIWGGARGQRTGMSTSPVRGLGQKNVDLRGRRSPRAIAASTRSGVVDGRM